ncbi:complex III assembly factor LYRM7 [Venturia canescens]|uniref:complex III assembly factor LYRM7 n=1 Tax=Venturia canescens TaxID=32260 RepID=UPI001C9D4DE2|nr:complex III assembly factor LYRM7 [Venturia canescens]
MSGNLRREALKIFKKLHRTRLNTFKGDEFALDLTRLKINEEFRKNMNVTDEAAVIELIKFAEAIEHEIRTTVIQAVEKGPGRYELRITDDTVKVSNEVAPGSYVPKEKLKKCTDSVTTGKAERT